MTDEYFYKWNRSADGYSSNCSKCQTDAAIERQRKAYEKGIGQIKRSRTYQKHREENDRKNKKYIQEHKEERLAWMKQYAKDNPEQFKKYVGNHRNHDMYDQEWESCKRFFNYRCACCGLPIEEHYVHRNGKMKWQDFEQDHVYHDGRNDIKNCIPLCSSCNNRKKRKSFNEFYNSNNPDYTYERYHQIYLWIRYEYKKYILPKRRHKHQKLSARLKEIELSKNGYGRLLHCSN